MSGFGAPSVSGHNGIVRDGDGNHQPNDHERYENGRFSMHYE